MDEHFRRRGVITSGSANLNGDTFQHLGAHMQYRSSSSQGLWGHMSSTHRWFVMCQKIACIRHVCCMTVLEIAWGNGIK